MKRHNRARTQTSTFGSRGRVNHDSSSFYSSRLYQDLPHEKPARYEENSIPPEVLDQLFEHSSEQMAELPDSSVHLMVTSPPYNVGKDYDEDMTLKEYRAFIQRVTGEVERVLVPGGRMCINLANLGRRPYLPLHSFIVTDLIEAGWLMRGEIIWNKGGRSTSSTAWGSWCSAQNPTLRDIHEYILVFSKGMYRRPKIGRDSTLERDEFLEATRSVWTLRSQLASKVGHPAPFPVELPHRLIQLYTYAGEVVLDPFIGSGQTALAALRTGRHFIGYDINPEYISLARQRISEEQSGTAAAP